MLSFLLLLLFAPSPPVKNGIDVLVEQKFAPLAGKRVGVITNHSAITLNHEHLIDLLAAAPNVKLVAIFTGEHGLSGTAAPGADVASSIYEKTGTPIYSLYQKGSQRPNPDMFKDIDALVYDMQDVGARFFTYITTLGYTLEGAGKAKIPFYVLDRPDPINGVAVEGPLLDPSHFSFVGYMRMPVRYGMTVGELSQMFNGENKLGVDLHVIKMEGWKRTMFFDETGQEWVNPSANMRSLTAAILYPGLCLLEAISVGRGTDTPYQMVGAPYWKGREMAQYMNDLKLPGASFIPRRFTTTAEPFKGQTIDGVEVQVLDRRAIDSVRVGLEFIAAMVKLYPGKFDVKARIVLLGSDDAAARLIRGESGAVVNQSFQDDLAAFRKMRQGYLLYE